ncbi:MAG: TetR family transcriptional regulator [Rhizobiales bacterium]|nr:TetR family transcriptional regulator [Hyphomicrobiales bacterium]
MKTDTHTRRIPTQARAKERVERILAAATQLISETGSDAVRMSEIAGIAQVPIGSLYQYFPDKPAILRMLAVRQMERVREGLKETFVGIKSRKDALERLDASLAGYYQLFLDEPVVRDIWSGTQSDKLLQSLDIEDSRRNGEILFEAIRHLVSPRHQARFADTAFLMMQLSGAAVRMAIAVERKEGDRLMDEYRRLLRAQIEMLLKD